MRVLRCLFAAILVFVMSFSSGSAFAAVRVVATTTMLADMAKVIGGSCLEVSALMGPGIDPHLYQASAGDVGKLQKADVVLYSGLHLEGKMGDIFEALKKRGKYVICAANGVSKSKLILDEHGAADPHIWFSTALWGDAAKEVSKGFEKFDAKNAAVYRANTQKYLKELAELQKYIDSKIKQVPKESRVLVTAHDAFSYFGRSCGFEVKGLQGISTEAEAGTADVKALAEFITKRRIKAVFVESSVPPKAIEALQAAVKARGFATSIGGELYSDSLGGKGSGAETYILTFKANVDTITNALK